MQEEDTIQQDGPVQRAGGAGAASYNTPGTGGAGPPQGNPRQTFSGGSGTANTGGGAGGGAGTWKCRWKWSCNSKWQHQSYWWRWYSNYKVLNNCNISGSGAFAYAGLCGEWWFSCSCKLCRHK